MNSEHNICRVCTASSASDRLHIETVHIISGGRSYKSISFRYNCVNQCRSNNVLNRHEEVYVSLYVDTFCIL